MTRDFSRSYVQLLFLVSSFLAVQWLTLGKVLHRLQDEPRQYRGLRLAFCWECL